MAQPVVVRAKDDCVRVFFGPKEVARHRRSWDVAQDIEALEHRAAALAQKPGARGATLPGSRYLKVLTASTKSLRRETGG